VYDKEEIMTTRPESLFEAASYDLNQFRERRMADRRFMDRDTPDRRKAKPAESGQQPGTETNVNEGTSGAK
jgi:hypothetical protein